MLTAHGLSSEYRLDQYQIRVGKPKYRPRHMLTKILALSAVVIVAGIVLRIYMPQFGSSVATGVITINGESVLGDCPDMPNCQGSESSRTAQQVERFAINGDPDKAMETLVSIISSHAGATLVENDERYAHFTFTSTALRFIDDVELLVSDDRESVQVRSASRLGKSDLGANAKRIEALRASLAGQL